MRVIVTTFDESGDEIETRKAWLEDLCSSPGDDAGDLVEEVLAEMSLS